MAMTLSDFPQPPGNNGRGLHGPAHNQRFNDPWDRWISELQQMNIKWMKLLDDAGSNADFSKELLNNGIMPIVRFYIDAPNPGRFVDDHRVDWPATLARYVANGVRYFEINNEPNLGDEWHTPYPANAPEIVMDNWIQDAELVISMGGLPAFPALTQTSNPSFHSVNWYRRAFAYLQTKYPDRAQNVFSNGAWIAVHAALLNHPVDYPYDAVNQRDHPGATIFDDDNCLLGYRVPLELLKETFGLTVPVISTEGGVFAPGESGQTQWDSRYPPITKLSHAVNTVGLFQWMMDQAPAEFFGICSWLIFSGTPQFEYDSWFRVRETLPVVQEIKRMKSYTKKSPAAQSIPLPTSPISPTSPTTPTTPPPVTPATPANAAAIARAFALSMLNITVNPDAALYRKAKELNFGRPVTNEIYGVIVSGARYVVQGFDKGVLYVKEGDWGNVQQTPWLG